MLTSDAIRTDIHAQLKRNVGLLQGIMRLIPKDVDVHKICTHTRTHPKFQISHMEEYSVHKHGLLAPEWLCHYVHHWSKQRLPIGCSEQTTVCAYIMGANLLQNICGQWFPKEVVDIGRTISLKTFG